MSNEDGTYVNLECITGYIGCDDEKLDDWTDFATSTINVIKKRRWKRQMECFWFELFPCTDCNWNGIAKILWF